MIDEFIFMKCHLIVFVDFVQKGLPLCVYMGLLHIQDGKKDACIIID